MSPEQVVERPLRSLAKDWHSVVGRAPRPLASAYLRAISLLSRRLPHWFGVRAWNHTLQHGAFPADVRLPAKMVTVGDNTTIRLEPHVGEFDGQALFTRRLDYERQVFRWLEAQVAKYDLVIEIGANVGIYTVFLDRHFQAHGQGRVIAFEPAPEAIRRLRENLRLNAAATVTVIEAAVGEKDGPVTFFEPRDHLTNGSFRRDFAGIFSDQVRETRVSCWSAGRLGDLIDPDERRVLVKIDVEGFEGPVLRALAPVIAQRRPDVLVEVLQEDVDGIEQLPWLANYRRFVLTADGPVEHPRVYADPLNRDWLLRPKS